MALASALLLTGLGCRNDLWKYNSAASGSVHDERGHPVKDSTVILVLSANEGMLGDRKLDITSTSTDRDGRFSLSSTHETAFSARCSCMICKKGFYISLAQCEANQDIVLLRSSRPMPPTRFFHGSYVLQPTQDDLMTQCELDEAAYARLISRTKNIDE